MLYEIYIFPFFQIWPYNEGPFETSAGWEDVAKSEILKSEEGAFLSIFIECLSYQTVLRRGARFLPSILISSGCVSQPT